jgi:hypothetical protein
VSAHTKQAYTALHNYPPVLQALPGRGYAGYLIGVILEVLRGLIQDPGYQLPRAPANRGESAPPFQRYSSELYRDEGSHVERCEAERNELFYCTYSEEPQVSLTVPPTSI